MHIKMEDLRIKGGTTAYKSRYQKALPGNSYVIRAGQALAYNPTCAGAKSEDTCIMVPGGVEVVTADEGGGWPFVDVSVQLPNGDVKNMRRPGILCRK